MRQPDAAPRGYDAAGVPAPRSGAGDWTGDQADDESRRLPPGQHVQATMPVLHYGRVPSCDPVTWDLQVYGATASGQAHSWGLECFRALPRREILADFHCVTKFTILGVTWQAWRRPS